MTKSEIIRRIVYMNRSLDISQARAIVDTIVDSITSAVMNGRRAEFRKFGVFSLNEKKRHETINPITRDRILVKKRRVMRFKASSVFIRKINEYKEVMR